MLLKTIEEEEKLEYLKFDLLVQATTLNRGNAKELENFNKARKELKEIVIGNSSPTKVKDELQDEEKFKEAFSRFKDEDGKPKSLNLTIGEPDTAAEFSNKSISELVDQMNSN